MAEETQNVKTPYRTVYDNFHSGGWYTAVLYKPREEKDDGLIRDGVSKPTELAEGLPATLQFLEGPAFEFFTVRVARLEPNASLWEHRDYVELKDDK